MAGKEASFNLSFCNNQHELSLIKKTMADIWKENKLCDLKIVVKEHEFNCHSIVIASNSKFFENKLSNSSDREVDISNMCSYQTFELILNFIYTGKIKVPLNLIEEFIKDAKVLEIDSLHTAINGVFSPEILNIDNVVCLTLVSYDMDIANLKEFCIAFLCKRFQEAVARKEFLELKRDILMDVILRDELLVNSEDEIIDAVLMWADFFPAERCDYLVDILKTVRLGLVQHLSVTKLLRHHLIKINPDALEFVTDLLEYIASGKKSSPSFVISERPRHKTSTFRVVTVGGDDSDILVQSFDLDNNYTLDKLSNFPIKGSVKQFSAVMGNKLYVSGLRTGKTYLYCYCPLENVWTCVSNVPFAIYKSCMVSVGQKLFFIGGIAAEKESKPTASLQCYDSLVDTWISLEDLPEERYGVAACGSTDGKFIYSFAGANARNTVTDEIFVYNLVNHTWTNGGTLPFTSYYSSAVCVGERVFVLGGWDGSSILKTFVEYLPLYKITVELGSMPWARSHFSAESFGRRIYIFGGKDEKVAKIINYVDLDNNKW